MKKILLICISIIMCGSPVFAQSALDIMRRVDDRDDGNSLISRIRMTSYRYAVRDGKSVPAENPRVKVMDFIRKDYGPKEKDHKSITILLEPGRERGISFLQYDYEEVGRDTDQWMYLSALGKVKRIVSGNENEPKTGSFFGSEFNYEDMESYNLADYTYTILGDEIYRKKTCWVIEATPVTRKAVTSNYSRAIMWIDKERDLILKSDLFNRNGRKEKQILYGKIETIEGILVPRKVIVTNLLNQRRTVMAYETIALNRPVEEMFLTRRTLTDKGFRERKLKEYQNVSR
ncbi:hypothetical protein DSLASN_13160 [Desulfoluna limicola]|uniref:Uncharacterized protein TP-0789 domain-containing protein n=1 Tax=Desulfoluna limicola TaxID=2810562 RepID=A0ABM7PF37_9BACT|nr:outer membrane lipoprotein-sorting protein [Desulfoluna limicola]BCS95684.1 hypothetical protein DSLASN_13160 [Desulfoluna limicola]